MKIQIQPEVKEFLNAHNYGIMTVTADRECVGANCSDAFTYPVIRYKLPENGIDERFDVFEVDGVTVVFEKKLETVPEIRFVKEHHLLRDSIRIEGLQTPPRVTHNKL